MSKIKKHIANIVIVILSSIILLCGFIFIPYSNQFEIWHGDIHDTHNWTIETVSPISISEAHTLAIQQDGSLWLWHNPYFSYTAFEHFPSAINKIMDDVRQIDISSVSMRNVVGTSLVLTNDGAVWDLTDGFRYYNYDPFLLTPEHISPSNMASNVEYVSKGNFVTGMLREDGSLWIFGEIIWNLSDESENELARLNELINNNMGLEGLTLPQIQERGFVLEEPVRFMDNIRWFSVAFANVAIKEDDSLWTWGGNRFGTIGDGTTIDRNTPVKILSEVQYVTSNQGHIMAITNDGTLWGWGNNSHGQVGNNAMVNQTSPVEILTNVIYVSTGDSITMAIREDNSLWAWGNNERGHIGDGTRISRTEPVHVLDNVLYVVPGDGSDAPDRLFQRPSLAIRTDGSLWAWGANDFGQIGNGTRLLLRDHVYTSADILRPARIMENVVYAAIGEHANIAIQSDGSLWAWGGNYALRNYLDGSNDSIRSVPVKIMENVRLTIHDGDN